METLKSAIKKAVSNAGVEKALKQESAVFLWADTVGQTISKVTKAEGVDKGVLTVKQSHPPGDKNSTCKKKKLLPK